MAGGRAAAAEVAWPHMADLEMPADRARAADGAVVEAHELTRVYGEGDTAVHALRGVTSQSSPGS